MATLPLQVGTYYNIKRSHPCFEGWPSYVDTRLKFLGTEGFDDEHRTIFLFRDRRGTRVRSPIDEEYLCQNWMEMYEEVTQNEWDSEKLADIQGCVASFDAGTLPATNAIFAIESRMTVELLPRQIALLSPRLLEEFKKWVSQVTVDDRGSYRNPILWGGSFFVEPTPEEYAAERMRFKAVVDWLRSYFGFAPLR